MVVELINGTPFSAESFVLPDRDGQETLLVVLVAVFAAGPDGKLELAREQRPVRCADVYHGEPGLSSIRYEAEIALYKPRVDLLVNGHAYAPGGKAASSVPVELLFGPLRKRLMVYGDRTRVAGIASSPRPFTSLPIIYERAYGGMVAHPSPQGDPRNLVGVGFKNARSASPDVVSDYANVVYPGNESVPAGFGPLARGWQPRLAYAGTFGSAWLADRAPLLPLDFDPRHNLCAPADQQVDPVAGGEPVVLVNMTPDGQWGFRLPRLDVPVLLLYQDRISAADLRVGTVLLEPDLRMVTLTASLAVPLLRGPGALREVALGHMKGRWLRARKTGKLYIDRRGDGGADRRARSYHL